MTDVASTPETTIADPDLITEETKVGNNTYHAGTVIADLPNDDSLRPRDRRQIPVPPNSLLWKYMGDITINAAVGQRLAIYENMWPQLGQGVSDHSVLVSKGDFKSLRERGLNTQRTIGGVVYGRPDQAKTYGLQIRNFHKSIKGDMPNARRYHAIASETFYWAHVTFFEAIYRASELGIMPLSREEKEQIFEESKLWFSMYGVDDRAQPETYAEFEEYLADVMANKLIDMGIAQYTAGSAKTADYVVRMVPRKYRKYMRLIAPPIAAVLRITTMGHMEPEILERLRLTEYWTEKDKRRYRRLLTVLRTLHSVTEKYRLPLRLRYAPFAIKAFEREGINPYDITLESARRALQENKARYAGGVPESDGAAVESADVAIAPQGAVCAKCERALEDCIECDGTGHVEGDLCDVCNGAQRGCPVHHADWRTAAVAE